MNPLLQFLLLLVLPAVQGFLPQQQSAPSRGSTLRWAAAPENSNDNEQPPQQPEYMKELQQRIHELENPYHDHEMFSEDPQWLSFPQDQRPEHVYIVVVQPDTRDQGMHSIEYPKGSGNNFVLAFPSFMAAQKFASTLLQDRQWFMGANSQPQDSVFMVPQRYTLESLEQLCDKLGVYVQIVPKGVDVLPPSQNVAELGRHNRRLKQEKHDLEYLFDMLDELEDDLGPTLMAATEELEAWQ